MQKILIADDEAHIRRLVCDFTSRWKRRMASKPSLFFMRIRIRRSCCSM